MELVKTHLFFSDHDNSVSYLIDTIWLADAWWLVGSWIEQTSTKERTPERLVRLTGLSFQEVNHPEYRFLLANALPMSALRGEQQDGYVTAMYQELAHIPVTRSIH